MYEPIQTILAFCPHCNGNRKCDVVARYHETEGTMGFTFWWDVLRCRGCETVFFAQHNSDPGSLGEPIYFPKATARIRPKWLRTRDRWEFYDIPHWHDRLGDFFGCLDAGLLVPAAVSARTAFDIAIEHLGIDSSLSFEKKLDELANSNRISLTDRDNLNVIVEAGSASVHRGWSPTIDEIQLIGSILEGFLERNFIQGPAAEELRDRIPPRPPRKKRD